MGIRVGLYLPGLYGGGAERVMLNLASGIAEQGYSVDLVLAQSEGPLLAEVPRTVRLIDLNARHLRGGRTVASFVPLLRYLVRERPRALLSALHANIMAIWARRLIGIPARVVIAEHNTFSRQNSQLPYWCRWSMLQLVRTSYPWADGIVAVSEGVADDLAQVTGMPRERIEVIFNPVITAELELKSKQSLKHPWFESGGAPVVVAMGRLTPQKDFGTLIRAFAQVRRERSLRLLILGEGEERTKLEALLGELGVESDVALPGFVANPFPYLAQASLFVLSSRWEGLPTVLVEALYCGTPVVATDCPSGPREILRDGRYGQLVPVGDPDSLARAIQSTLVTAHAPSRESWELFKQQTAVDQYLKILGVA